MYSLQRPLEEISGAARFADVPDISSLSSGRRLGSMVMSLNTSLCSSALKSLRALCHTETYPPLAHTRIWSMEFSLPHPLWCVCYSSSKAEADSVSKLLLIKTEAMIFQRECCQPGACTLFSVESQAPLHYRVIWECIQNSI